MERQPELDWLRGLMLVLMTMTHLPTWFSHHVGQPFGFVSAAEGFVFLSAFLVGGVYTHWACDKGIASMRRALWRRTFKVYCAHVAVLMFLLLLLVPIAIARHAEPVTDLASFYLERPLAGLVGGMLLVYNPPLLDILPMYVVLLAVSPFVLARAMRTGWTFILTASTLIWVLAQLGGGQLAYDVIASRVGAPVPYAQTGAFSLLAWQLLWMLGLAAGARRSDRRTKLSPTPRPWPTGVVISAGMIALAFFAWRHATGQTPTESSAVVNALVDKWTLGPLRLLNFAALAVLAVYFRAILVATAEHSSITTLGRASLTVFCTQLLACLGVLAVFGNRFGHQFGVTDIVLLAGTFAVLYGVARVSLGGRNAPRTRSVPLPVDLERRKPPVLPVTGGPVTISARAGK